ncbi:peptidase S53 propeptide [Secundilactobacillus kimchicus JCM 15530]|uniref:Peptidase S53 propeptide n=1 Tax=Secundilactobacillus kimchicus JCM 15530 TaxID=1302272 RepID=A0A0R1HMB9_9LACO|nr:S53 family peptidase [Secundilactobacillus kimchicus]KRK47528.1 peptidase S53 propeptide [Secundilactobacillus kimchicus JCM 15530]
MKQKGLRLALAAVGGALIGGGVFVATAQSAQADQISVSLVLKPHNAAEMAQAAYATVDPTSPNYHHYLSAGDVATQFGHTTSEIQQFKDYFSKYKLRTSVYHGNLYLRIKGNYNSMMKAFKATRTATAKSDRTSYKLPGNLQDQLVAVVGLTSKDINGGKKHQATKKKSHLKTHVEKTSDTPNTGLSNKAFSEAYGVAKFADRYQVNKLYDRGLTGTNQQIGIISGSDFNVSDVSKYLEQVGVTPNVSRIQKQYIGPKKDITNLMSSPTGRPMQFETTLDVDQAASVAPNAGVQVYIVPGMSNYVTNEAAMLNGFAYAIADNKVRQISTSYAYGNELIPDDQGESETITSYNNAYNVIFQQAAVEGITIFNASGDSGPYMEPSAKQNLSIPTSEYQVEVGGTTIPFQKITTDGQLVQNDQERAWGKLSGLTKAQIKQGIFSGSTGGFSRLNPTPKYQLGVPGVNTFNAIQHLTFKDDKYTINKNPKMISGTGSGRNVPDVAGNADADTGYAVYVSYTKTPNGDDASKTWSVAGGTSFVAPQMAAVNALMNSGLNAPIGFWNPQIYKFAQSSDSPFTPLDSITNNDNLYYTGQPGKLYNQATGLGTINFDKLYSNFGGK